MTATPGLFCVIFLVDIDGTGSVRIIFFIWGGAGDVYPRTYHIKKGIYPEN